jgi:hypothetical protein
MGSTLEHIGARLDGIGHLLRDLHLSVPTYQRPYSWGVEQVETFWTDLRAALEYSSEEYFLGTVVLSGAPSSRQRVIIDGQQRLATATLLLAAIRDVFREFKDSSRAEVLQNDYLSQKSLKTSEREPRLRLNTQDAKYFEGRILGLPDPGAPAIQYVSNQSLEDAYVLLKGRMWWKYCQMQMPSLCLRP